MDELRTYADRRLELGDMIRAALHLARGYGDERAENRARDLLSRLAADTFQLAVAGQFSRGKTTLMNALLGGPYLPMGALPMTSVITTVRYGSRPKAIVRRRASGLGAEVPLAQVAAIVSMPPWPPPSGRSPMACGRRSPTPPGNGPGGWMSRPRCRRARQRTGSASACGPCPAARTWPRPAA